MPIPRVGMPVGLVSASKLVFQFAEKTIKRNASLGKTFQG